MGRLPLFWDFPIFRFNTNIKERTWRNPSEIHNNLEMVLNNSVFELSSK